MREGKETAVCLREKGKSYNEINKLLGVPKSTLSIWLKGIEISPEAKRELWNDGRRKWAENFAIYNKKRSEIALESARFNQNVASRTIGHLTKRELLLVGAALYWAEGDKKDRWNIRFCNSDPAIIKVMMDFFKKICYVKKNKFRAEIQIHPNIVEKETKVYWSKITGIPTSQFIKTQIAISKSSKFKRPANKLPYGTLRIKISDINLVNKLKGWILGLS